MNLPARSVYIHVPFCSHRCGYCNFTLISGRDELIPAFLEALEGEMSQQLPHRPTVDTIFLGGGTPSHLAASDLERLLTIVERWVELAPQGEYSCEANPLDCTPERIHLLRDHGVNRLSLGGQSFDDRKLKRLERDHTGQQLSAALELCASHLPRVALDLIFATPEETLATWQSDVARGLSSPIQHLSTYGLTIERGSAFYGRTLRSELTELSSDLQLSMYQYAIDTLSMAGWEHYEVSNFALPHHRCRHNEAYWLGAPWWAFGPGAASFEHSQDGSSFRRSVNHRSTTTYLNKFRAGQSLIAESEQLSREDYVRERLVFGLRRLQGVTWRELDQVWGGAARELFEPYLSRYLESGMLSEREGGVQLTRAGLVISDSLWPDLLSPAAR
jgi:oxygen-independent coproporphyrinogen III oxidase